MRCDTCKKESPLVMRVVVAKDYDRTLARPVYNCPSCFENKEQSRNRSKSQVEGRGAKESA